MLPCQGKVIQELYTNYDYVTKITVTKCSVIAATLNKPDCPNSPSLPRLLRCNKELGCRFYENTKLRCKCKWTTKLGCKRNWDSMCDPWDAKFWPNLRCTISILREYQYSQCLAHLYLRKKYYKLMVSLFWKTFF